MPIFVIIVSSPQDLALMVVRKAIKMASSMNVPILGLIENMSYAVCPKCGETLRLLGRSRGEEAAEAAGIPYLGALPLDPVLAELCDSGQIERYDSATVRGSIDWSVLSAPV